jgi:antitoxin component YwqK of YwqJK toxin-antitoxin module
MSTTNFASRLLQPIAAPITRIFAVHWPHDRGAPYNDLVVRIALTCVLVACGTGAGPTKQTPVEPPPPAKLTQTIDAGVPEAPPPPKLVCDEKTTPTPAPMPEPTWFCASADGTRNGPFVTLFPDHTIEIKGTYKDGKLEGAWERNHPNGKLAEKGEYAAGLKTGKWSQTSTTGAVLGDYEMNAGTGVEKRWHDEGWLYSETPYKAGVLEGTQRIYTKDKLLIGSTRYRNDKLDGPHTFGTVKTMRFEETFWQGVRRGKRLIFHQGGLIAEENYAGGKLHGPYTLWRNATVARVKGQFTWGRRTGDWVWHDKKGRKEKEGKYVNGRRDGAWTEWDDEKVTWSGTYDAGKPNGTFTYWDRNGNEIGKYEIKDGTGVAVTFWAPKKPSSKTRLYKGYEDGAYQEFNRAGRMVVEGHYAGGIKHGVWKEWNWDGVLILEEHWKRGKLDGTVKKYVDGQLSMEATYVEGKANGAYVEYRAGNKPALTGQFADDLRTGTWTSYNADGNVVRIATYKDGVLEGPYRELAGGAVHEGTMVAGRRSGTWTRTDKGGAVRKLVYRSP